MNILNLNVLLNRLVSLPNYLIPKLALTVLAGSLASIKAGSLTTRVIRWYVDRYSVNMTEAATTDIASYKTFQEFFTRPLKSGARPLANTDFVCPVDGAISNFGQIECDQILQTKGHKYSIAALVGGDRDLAAEFENGSYATLYLSPGDYHRVHMPCDARLIRMVYIPGTHFSVNPTTVSKVPGLFARNERVVCIFDSEFGRFALTLVGATIVGSMATFWHGIINPPRPGRVREWNYEADTAICLKKGEEMGRFLLGSTVVILFPKSTLTFNPAWSYARQVRMGEFMGQVVQ